jgi:hypothetical protein
MEFTTDNARQIPRRSISKIPDILPERSSCGDVRPAVQCNFSPFLPVMR